jgi:type II secretory pathway component PulF
MLFAYLHYHQARQEEFLQLLTTAVESEAPLAPALWSYLSDRPHGPVREFWVAVLLFFVIPGYYWVWHRRHSFDHKVARVACLLEDGWPLSAALRAVPGVASADTLLAVSVGESTGRLALCLRGSAGGRLAAVWLEVLPRLLYPLVLLFVLSGVVSFWMLFILPRLQRIFADFGDPLPGLTRRVADFGSGLGDLWGEVMAALGAGVVFALLVPFSSAVLWHVPGFGRVYRMHVRSRVLKMLSVLLEAGRPVPQALDLLAGSGAFSQTARQRLAVACRAVKAGEPLADSLRQGGLLQPAMIPLVQAAERMRNVPWVLAELGESLANRAARLLRRISLVFLPASVLAVGLLIGFIVLGMFMPLVDLVTRLSE